MNTIRNIYYYLIHSIPVLYSRIRGHNRGGKVIMNGQVLDMKDFQKMFQPVPCLVCSLPIKHGLGQEVKYHRYCRQFRNNHYGFDPSKIDHD